MQRFGLVLVFAGLAMVLGVVLHLLTSGIGAASAAPFAPALLCAAAGALLVSGMALIERHREPDLLLPNPASR